MVILIVFISNFVKIALRRFNDDLASGRPLPVTVARDHKRQGYGGRIAVGNRLDAVAAFVRRRGLK